MRVGAALAQSGGVGVMEPVRAKAGKAGGGTDGEDDAVATRFDKLAVRYEATIHLAAINEWL